GAHFVFNDETGDAVLNQFRHRAAVERYDWRAARHGFNHDQPKRLRPVDRHEQRERVAQELGLLRVGDLPDILDMRFGEQRPDYFLEVIMIDRVDFRGDLERQAAALGDANGPINPLLWRDASQESEIGWTRWHGAQEIQRHPVVNRADPI